MPRTLGSITTTDINNSQQRVFTFVRFDFGTGVIRATDRPESYTGDIDGASQTWSPFDVRIGQLTAGLEDPRAVTYVECWNLDWVFTNKADEIRGTNCAIYEAWFNPSTDALIDKVMLYEGVMDDAQLDNKAKITVRPYLATWARNVPSRLIGPTCPYNFKDANCGYAGAGTSCGKQRADCVAYSNQARFGGFDLMPLPNQTIIWS